MTVDWFPVIVSVVALVGLLLARVPVAFGLAAAAAIGYSLLAGPDIAQATFGSLPFSVVADYNLVLVPMFMVMGLLANAGGILTAVFDLAERLLRRLPGGLAVAATVSAGFLGGISGSSVADTATLGRITITHMARRGYDLGFAAAVVASSNTVAILIPPSLALVLIGIVTEQPIGPLLLAGIIPGALSVLAYACCSVTMARLRPQVVFAQTRRTAVAASTESAGTGVLVGDATDGSSGRVRGLSHVRSGADQPDGAPRADWIVGAAGLLAGTVLIVTVLGGLYTGLFTAVEAGFAGATMALVMAVGLVSVRRRRVGEGSYGELVRPFHEAASLTGMVFLLLIGATLFSNFLILAGVPSSVAQAVLDSSVPPLVAVALFILVTLLLGMILDPIATLLIVAPIAFPVVSSMGYSEIWFAILFVKAIEIGLLTPPVGINAYVVASVVKGLRVEQVFARLVPFILTELVVLTVLFFLPEISTWLPHSTRGG